MARRLFHRIKEVAHQLGEPVSTIRYWENVFPQISPHTTPKGVRQYTEKDIETFRAIRYLLREKGMTIEGAISQLNIKKTSLELRSDTLCQLRQIRHQLQALREALD